MLSFGCWYDIALDAAGGFSSFCFHVAGVQSSVFGVCVGNEQGCHIIFHRNFDIVSFVVDGGVVVSEFQVGLVTGSELDVKPDVVTFVNVHFFESSCRFDDRSFHGDHVISGLHHVQIGAGLARAYDVLDQASEDSGVVGASLFDHQDG